MNTYRPLKCLHCCRLRKKNLVKYKTANYFIKQCRYFSGRAYRIASGIGCHKERKLKKSKRKDITQNKITVSLPMRC